MHLFRIPDTNGLIVNDDYEVESVDSQTVASRLQEAGLQCNDAVVIVRIDDLRHMQEQLITARSLMGVA